jgi:hypothetical protein
VNLSIKSSRPRRELFQSVKEHSRTHSGYGKIEKTGGVKTEQWKRYGRKEVVMTDLDAIVPKDHLLRKTEKVMD